jgi:hypothetical protein|tara:strand:- start:457 stop:630 length:174 start_codon:yes stop_codon:yes gene_type:complete
VNRAEKQVEPAVKFDHLFGLGGRKYGAHESVSIETPTLALTDQPIETPCFYRNIGQI